MLNLKKEKVLISTKEIYLWKSIGSMTQQEHGWELLTHINQPIPSALQWAGGIGWLNSCQNKKAKNSSKDVDGTLALI